MVRLERDDIAAGDWVPTIEGRTGYRSIVRAHENAVEAGVLAAGDRLPTQRRLAENLHVSLSTVTRAYTEATRRGLLEGTVGKGTFISDRAGSGTRWALNSVTDPALIDLSLNDPPPFKTSTAGSLLKRELAGLMERLELDRVMSYQPHAGALRHRRAGAEWIQRTGLATTPAEVLVCNGAQHATACALGVLAKPGDVVFTESLTAPGIKDLARWLGLRLYGLVCDENGIVPDALDAACSRGVSRVLFTMPVLHNPTTVTMTVERREEVAEVLQKHQVAVIENGVHGLLPGDGIRPLAAFCPELVYYITSLSKTIAPGLRVGFLRAPRGTAPQLEDAIRATVWMSSPFLGAIAAEIIESGTAEAVLNARRGEAAARQRIAKTILRGCQYDADPSGYHLWMLPGRWTVDQLVSAAKRRGVAVTPSAVFVPHSGHPPSRIRLSLGVAPNRETLTRGLQVIADLLRRDPLEAD